MTIIHTCPQCGGDLLDIELTCYPPKRTKSCSNCGWQYTFDDDNDKILRVPFVPANRDNIQRTVIEIHDTTKEFNDPCLGCSNHPKNGGSGICNCTVPYMAPNSPYTITC